MSSSGNAVTIVKVGGGQTPNYGGSRGELTSYSTAVRNITSAARKSESRSIGRLPTHRSMTRLNDSAVVRPPSSVGLHKSMSKLTSSQQNMARSSSQVVAATPAARSVTCITSHRGHHQQPLGGPSSLTTAASTAATGGYMSGRVTISTGPGASSPTKSMSSGSMSGIVQDPGLIGANREVVTVNVNQINEDLIRQVGAVSNTVINAASNSYLQGIYNQRKSSGNLATVSSQPPSLLSSTTTPIGPILPMTTYESGGKLNSGISQPLSSMDFNFQLQPPAISRVTSTSGPVPTRRSNLSNTLPSPRRRQQIKEMLDAKSSKDDASGVKPQNVISNIFVVKNNQKLSFFRECRCLNRIRCGTLYNIFARNTWTKSKPTWRV